ncbi:TRAP transporter small permease subunit [Desulfovibrionales bacterium]
MNTFISKLEEGIISLLLASMTLLVFVEVVLRFGFNVGLLWAQEMTLLLSGWLVMFGASYGLKAGAHIGVDALVKIFPGKVRRCIAVVAIVLCLVYCTLFLIGSWAYLGKLMRLGIPLEDIPIPKWIANSILFLGMVMLAIRLLGLLWAVIQGRADGFKLLDEAKESMYLVQQEAMPLDGDDE